MLICLMSLKNQVVYIQFHPVAYMVKLNIEMSMASLITKIARHSVEARNNEFMVQSSSHFQTHTSQVNAAIGLKPGVNVSAVSKMRGGEEREEFDGIRTLKEVDVVVESMAVPGDTRWRKSESDSTEDGFGRKPVSKMGSEDELPLAPPEVPKRVEWKN
jgi:hypothetical protein